MSKEPIRSIKDLIEHEKSMPGVDPRLVDIQQYHSQEVSRLPNSLQSKVEQMEYGRLWIALELELSSSTIPKVYLVDFRGWLADDRKEGHNVSIVGNKGDPFSLTVPLTSGGDSLEESAKWYADNVLKPDGLLVQSYCGIELTIERIKERTPLE